MKCLIGLGPHDLSLNGFLKLFEAFDCKNCNPFKSDGPKCEFHDDIAFEDPMAFCGIVSHLVCNDVKEFKKEKRDANDNIVVQAISDDQKPNEKATQTERPQQCCCNCHKF